MRASEYQEGAKRTLNAGLAKIDQTSNMIFGILGESGEIADILKKHMYQGHDSDIVRVREEIGDLMWYIANLCNVLEIELADCMAENRWKLLERYPDGFEVERSVNREVGENCENCKYHSTSIFVMPCSTCDNEFSKWEAE